MLQKLAGAGGRGSVIGVTNRRPVIRTPKQRGDRLGATASYRRVSTPRRKHARRDSRRSLICIPFFVPRNDDRARLPRARTCIEITLDRVRTDRVRTTNKGTESKPIPYGAVFAPRSRATNSREPEGANQSINFASASASRAPARAIAPIAIARTTTFLSAAVACLRRADTFLRFDSVRR